MNLAVRGISGNLGDVAGDSFFKDQHEDLKADFIMANPPFNQKQWREESELVDDPRWAGFEIPPTGNANYAWIMHMISKLSEKGTAGFVLANGSMSSNTGGEGKIRQKILENDLVDCMIALPGQLFYTTQIPVCLWFISKNKKADQARGYRNRQGETLFIDARELGSMISRTNKELTNDDIAEIAATYHNWRNIKQTSPTQEHNVGRALARQSEQSVDDLKDNLQKTNLQKETSPTQEYNVGRALARQSEQLADDLKDNLQKTNPQKETYQNIAGYCKSATLEEIKANDYVLTPGRYVGAAEIKDDGIPFEVKMKELSKTLYSQMEQAEELDNAIRQNLKVLGYGK